MNEISNPYLLCRCQQSGGAIDVCVKERRARSGEAKHGCRMNYGIKRGQYQRSVVFQIAINRLRAQFPHPFTGRRRAR
jgi:hypothetical protein